MTDARTQAEQEFALIVTAGMTGDFELLAGDHHLAFDAIWNICRAETLREVRELVRNKGWHGMVTVAYVFSVLDALAQPEGTDK